jgi:hypothetical protein
MGFQLKDFISITAAMINRARATQGKVTDFNVGSVARTLIEAPAIEIEELYQRMFAGILDAIPVAIYRGFNFGTLEAAKARGAITITFGAALAQPFSLPAGAVFQDPATGYRYLLETAVSAAPGATSLVGIVTAENTGAAYNVAANGIGAVLGVTLPTGSDITHAPLTSGSDGEGELERASRFAEYIQSLSRGTPQAVRYGAATARVRNLVGEIVESVGRIGIEEIPGDVRVYIHGDGSPASSALVAEAQRIIDGFWDGAKFVDGYRPVGVNVLVMPMTSLPRNLAVTIEMVTGAALTDALRNDIISRVTEVLDGVEAGETLYVDDLKSAVLFAPGVAKVRLDMAENFLCPANIVLVPGTITVTE